MTEPSIPSNEPRGDGRSPDELRPVSFVLDAAPAAAGSVLVKLGLTEVLCAVSLEPSVPRWMRAQKISGGWLTAEYSLLPYATSPRTSREASLGRVGGRTQEIQRMIGRALRAVIDLDVLGPRTLWIDCDVIRADGGTRTAAITGAGLALRRAVHRLLSDNILKTDPLRDQVAAVSVGRVDGKHLLDLNYEEDFAADVDMNVIMTGGGQFIEIQGAGEGKTFARDELDRLLALAERGVRLFLDAQPDPGAPSMINDK